MGTDEARIPGVGSRRESMVSRVAGLPSCAGVMLLSEWPRSAASKYNARVDEASLRKQFGDVAEADWRHLYRAAIRAGVDAQEAEDLVQEVFLRAYRSLTSMAWDQLVDLRVHDWLTTFVQRVAKERIGQKRAAPLEP
jgi:hypothetical protein